MTELSGSVGESQSDSSNLIVHTLGQSDSDHRCFGADI